MSWRNSWNQKLADRVESGNLFNRKEAFAFTFNGEFGKIEGTIIVPMMFLWPVFQGKMPKPENFRE